MKKASIRANYTYNMIYQVLNIILPLVTTPYISRVLGADGIGIYSYTHSIVTTFVMVGSLGIGTYGQKEIAGVSDDRNKVSIKFLEIQMVKTIAVMIATLVFLAMSLIYRQYTIHFWIQLPFFFGAIFDISWLYQGLENFKSVAIRNIIIKFASLLMIFAFVKNENHLIIYILFLGLAQIFGDMSMWLSLKKILVKVNTRQLSLKQHIKPTFVYFVPTISYQIYAVLDKTMLGIIYNDPAENGFYEQAHKLIHMVVVIISSYTIVMRSRMTVYFSKNNIEKIQEHLINSFHFIGFLVFPMTFGLAAIAENIVPWFFGPEYEKIITLLIIFSPFFVIHSIGACIGTHILTPNNMQGKSNIGQCIATVINVFLNAILIPQMGSIGAAIASVMAECIIVIIYMHYVKAYLNYWFILKKTWRYFIAALCMFVGLRVFIPYLPTTIIGSLVAVVVGVIVYFVCLWVLGDKYFKTTIINTVEGLRKKIIKP